MKRKVKITCLCIVLLLMLYPTACSKTNKNQEKSNTILNTENNMASTKDTNISENTTKNEKNIESTANDKNTDQSEDTAETKNISNPIVTTKSEQPTENTDISTKIIPFQDVRSFKKKFVYKKDEYMFYDMYTYSFDSKITFEGYEGLQKKIMEQGKNPGLGIRDLHKEGVTGKGVNVAIIDQNMFTDHPEYKDRIAEYYDTGCKTSECSMHGPGVTSLLVGRTIGVAPDAMVYYVAVPSWKKDSEYYAKGLYWIIDKNKVLPDDQKIKVVSVSAAPSGEYTPYEKNTEMWDEAIDAAEAEGILVIDCRENEKTAFIDAAMYDRDNPEDVSLCQGGFPTFKRVVSAEYIGVPVAYRTVAREYDEGDCFYQYDGQAGISWGIPYASGVLALGWQVNPALDKDQIIQLLFDTCASGIDGSNMINPKAFIEAVKMTVQDESTK